MIPANLYGSQAVQVLLLLLQGAAIIWLFKRSIKHGELLAKLYTVVTNHYSHRFDKVAKELGIEEWEDEE